MPAPRSRQMALLLAAVAAVHLAAAAAGKAFFLTQLTMTAYYTLVVVGLCLLMGYAGQISLGHAGFFAIGGYTSAFLTTFDLSAWKNEPLISLLAKVSVLTGRPDLYGGQVLTVQPWAACIAAVTITTVVAFAIGIPVLKLKGHYLAMATLGFGTIISSIVLGTQKLGAADGISGVPAFALLPGVPVTGGSSYRVLNYYIAWGLVCAGMLLLMNLIHSRVGRALRSIHGAEDAAGAMGVDTARYKLNTFVLSAVFAAVGGVFLTHFNGGIGPSEASIMKSVRYVAIVAVGGMANLWGALIMSAVLNFLSLRGYFGTYDDTVFGVILILIMLFSPEGVLSIDLKGMVRKLLKQNKTTT